MTIYYVAGIGVAFLAIIIGFSFYLWKKLKEEKSYKSEALPELGELRPEDLVVVSSQQDNISLPEISEEDEIIEPVSNFIQRRSEVENPFDTM